MGLSLSGSSPSAYQPSASSGGYQPLGGTSNAAGAYKPPTPAPPTGGVQPGPVYHADGSNDPKYQTYLGAYNNPNGYGNPQGGPQLTYAQYVSTQKNAAAHPNVGAPGVSRIRNQSGGPNWGGFGGR